jgi:glutathione S-transferase
MSDRRLFELVADDGTSISPFVWRTKYALGAKKLDYETYGVGFTDIVQIDDGRFTTVPVLQVGERYVGDSWVIADYLDSVSADETRLFSSPAERAMAQFFDEWLGSTVRPLLFRICVKDIHDRLRPGDRGYFRTSREQRLGESLEAAAAGREKLVPTLRAALGPLRSTLGKHPFLGGTTPNYADFIGLGTFIWAGSVATVSLLAADDPLRDWVFRGLNFLEHIGSAVRLPGFDNHKAS